MEILELMEAGSTVVIKVREVGAAPDDVSLITFGFKGGCIDSIAF